MRYSLYVQLKEQRKAIEIQEPSIRGGSWVNRVDTPVPLLCSYSTSRLDVLYFHEAEKSVNESSICEAEQGANHFICTGPAADDSTVQMS